ncbi:tyrosine-protein phosphatase [Saccharopolyspora gloriosae]|uniref:tyrosine-protein phosphatase n=1 Tax=Saccharopolyspora gloriosae TaxID=455344 RepID=UPI001FB76387|nr:tyrosine-protein phosphatase [Saccharopolyspora gloriosae]
MTANRDLPWDGAFNVRDLGATTTVDGRTIRRGALVRSATPEYLTETGWAQVHAHGIRTIIDLTGEDTRPDLAPRPPELTTKNIRMDPTEDTEFWAYWGRGLHGTPLYYRPFLDRHPQRAVELVRTFARAPEGGVLVHCHAGRDRTGIAVLLLLLIAGVGPAEILADHLLSHERLRPLWAKLGADDQEPIIEAALADLGSSTENAMRAATEIDINAYLLDAGLTADDLTAARDRLLEPVA